MASKKVLSADNQQERLRIPHPWYITGLVDGEGSFHIALYKDERMRTHLKVIPEFHVSQNKQSRIVLEELQRYFSCGNIKANHRGRKSDRTYVFVVRNREDLLKKIISFFEKYQLRTTKALDLSLFARVVRMMMKDQHKTSSGAKRIISLAYKMNDAGKRRMNKEYDLIKIVESSETIRETQF
jgi:hypothetical protein